MNVYMAVPSRRFLPDSQFHTWVPAVVDNVYSAYDISQPDELAELSQLADTSDMSAQAQKAGFDYMVALQHCLEHSQAPYVAIMEDDVVLADGALVRALKWSKTIEATMARRHKAGKWSHLQLFHGARPLVWSSAVGMSAQVSVVLMSLAVAALLFLRKRRLLSPAVDNCFLLAICCLYIPAATFLFFFSGELPWASSRGSGILAGAPPTDDAPGIIFPRATLPSMLSCLKSTYKTLPHGLAIGECAATLELDSFSTASPRLQQIRPHPDLTTEEDTFGATWDPLFEDLDPRVLHEEHTALLREMYS